MRKLFYFLSAFIVYSGSANDGLWFVSPSVTPLLPLVQSHRYLLENNLPAMYSSVIETWQSDDSAQVTENLNSLLQQMLGSDCGKNFGNSHFPDWIQSVTIKVIDEDESGRISHAFSIRVHTTKTLKNIFVLKKIDSPLSLDSDFVADKNDHNGSSYIKRYRLNKSVSSGLYWIEVKAQDDTSWGVWLPLARLKNKAVLHWNKNVSWSISNMNAINDDCPLERLTVSLYDFLDGEYKKVSSKNYVSEFPTSMNKTNVPSDRYMLELSLSNEYWQEQISIEEVQIIKKTRDISHD